MINIEDASSHQRYTNILLCYIKELASIFFCFVMFFSCLNIYAFNTLRITLYGLLYNGSRFIYDRCRILSEITLLAHLKSIWYLVCSENILLTIAFADDTDEDLPVQFNIFVKISPIGKFKQKLRALV